MRMPVRGASILIMYRGLLGKSSGLIVYRLLSSVYAASLLILSFSILDSEKYGLLSLALVKYALLSRIVAFGFDYIARELVDEEKFSFKNILTAKAMLYTAFLCSLFLFCSADFLVVSAVSGCLLCFELAPFYQAKQAMRQLAHRATIVYGVGGVVFASFNYLDILMPEVFFALITMPPSLVWMLHFFCNGNIKGRSDIGYSFRLLKRCAPMALVTQIPSSYSNVIPLLVGSQSVEMAGVFYFLMRISNLGKMIGLIINQAMYYSRTEYNRSLGLVILNSATVFIVVFLGGVLASVFFSNKFLAIYEERYLVLITLAFLTFNSVVVSYVVADVFLKKSYYFQYFCTALVVIIVPMFTYWITNNYTIARGLAVHITIEFCLLVGAVIHRRINKSNLSSFT